MPDIAVNTSLRLKPYTLLIIDDCPEDREVYCEYLSSDPQYSYQFLEAPLAEVGLELLQKHRCDVILLDFRMPDMDGLEFLERLQHYQQLGDCPPVIMLTGKGSEDLAARVIKQGVQDYLIKQALQPETLQLTVRNVIQQSEVRTQLSKSQERQRLISTTALRIRQSLNLDTILRTVVSEIQQLLECDHVAIYQLNADNVIIRAELGTRATPPSIVCDRDPEPTLISDVLPDIVAPIFVSLPSARHVHHQWGYLIAHQSTKKTPWSSEEHAIVNELTIQLAIAIQQAELLTQTQAALEKATELNTFKSQIIATVSHEYRTPLATILTAASTLEQHYDQLSEEKRLRFLKMIQMKARHMTTLVNDMLAVHQFELDPSQFQPAPINMLPFLADIIEGYREKVQDTHPNRYEFRFSVAGRISSIWGDGGMLRIAIDNLLSNAVKFSLDGGLIDISVNGDGKGITLTIGDNGIGIPENDQPMIFQSFSRANNVGTVAGTGIGLSIVKACVDFHGGTILLDSLENQGTRISITIPDNRHKAKAISRCELEELRLLSDGII
ncbi:MAG: hybrid sensor histidine kinase/response regulator [Cyanobacteria bacterium P01_F01_bin.150]